jgi:hypothetical protein
MTTTSTAQPLTTAGFLFAEADDDLAALAQALDHEGTLRSLDTALGQLTQAGREAAHREIATVAHGLFDLDLGALVVAGWRKQAAFSAAIGRTRATPGSSEVVELASHRIVSAYRPAVDVLVNDVHVATIHFVLALEFSVKALVLTVRDGHLTSIRSGTCEVLGVLSAEGTNLVSRQEQFELPLLIRLPFRIQPDVSSRRDGTARPLGRSRFPRPTTPTPHRTRD